MASRNEVLAMRSLLGAVMVESMALSLFDGRVVVDDALVADGGM